MDRSSARAGAQRIPLKFRSGRNVTGGLRRWVVSLLRSGWRDTPSVWCPPVDVTETSAASRRTLWVGFGNRDNWRTGIVVAYLAFGWPSLVYALAWKTGHTRLALEELRTQLRAVAQSDV